MSSFHLASVVRRRPSWQPASAPVSLPDQLSRCQLLPPPAPPPSALPSHPGKDRSARQSRCHAASCSAHLLHPPVPCPLIQVATCLICKMVNLRNVLLLVLLQNDNLLCTFFLHHIVVVRQSEDAPEYRRHSILLSKFVTLYTVCTVNPGVIICVEFVYLLAVQLQSMSTRKGVK